MPCPKHRLTLPKVHNTVYGEQSPIAYFFATSTPGQLYVINPIPATSEWGLAVMVLLVLVGGTLVMRRCAPKTA